MHKYLQSSAKLNNDRRDEGVLSHKTHCKGTGKVEKEEQQA